MKYEDYESKLKSATAENFQTVLLDVMEDLKTDLTERDNLADSIGVKDSKIRELQDTNMKLFLSVGKTVDDKDPEDEEEQLRKQVDMEIETMLGGK